MKKLIILAAILSAVTVQAQIIQPIKWKFSSSKSGNEVELRFTATMEKGWHLYDTDLPDGGPIPTAFVFEDSTAFTFVGELTKSPAPTEVFDKTFAMNLRYFSDSVTFTRKLQITDPNLSEIKGTVNFMGCDDESCLPPEELPFSFMVGTEVPAGSSDKAAVTEGDDVAGTTGQGQSLWIFILISLAAGFAAVLTPCVFPMIPMTVSFFMRGSKDRGKALRNALFFGFSILAIFAILGGLFSFGIFGPNVGSILSTHWLPNALFFILFFIFALSFFGLFEIVLPRSLVNKTDAKAESGGFMGAFFMALTTVIVSFSCTGPFIGALIIQAVQNGGLQPLIGMFFFGLAFATPFTLLAIFPSAINKLPKSGGWLNSIKVVFAFILLAFGLKFLSNIDQVYGFGILNREIYLAIWIVIFAMMGFYFLGKIRFEHDSEIPHLGVGRLLLSMVTFTFVVYLFTGLLGAPLKSISALIPPPTYKQQPVVAVSSGNSSAPVAVCGPATYGDKLHLPQGLSGYFVYKEGAACAKEQNKPLLVVFKGHACANCKKMENSVWTDPEVLQMLAEKYVIVGLYTDDRTTLPEGDWITAANGNVLKTMGKVNLDMQIAKYGTNSIPYHVILEPDGTEHKLAVTFDNGEFRDFIRKGIE